MTMKLSAKRAALLTAAAALSFGAVEALATTAAFGYGKADNPVAQVTLSGNCDNPAFPLCAPPPDGVGLGGIWAWSELDANTGSATSGTMDATVAECGHTVGGGGPGSAGAGGGPDPFGTWQTYDSLGDAMAANPAAFPFYDPTTYQGSVYLMDFFPGSGSQDFVVAVPTQKGHYNQHPTNGVSLQATVAP
jgi:hypothetical protein